MADHWFDTLNQALVRENQRRTLLQAAAALILGLGLGPAPHLLAGPRGKPVNKNGASALGRAMAKTSTGTRARSNAMASRGTATNRSRRRTRHRLPG
jgi:hypothetical protein